ncbi:MAG: hypothetical protein GX580_06820 [Candidatus Hydrogenedens sp.]|nr:hypothetical protein [Candidatus Hydrogenedentota bacterium]NLF57333.1 hypothetical protein [Candidatus Hydrogenedens sp.]
MTRMTWTRLLLREMAHSRWNTLATLLAVAAAAGLYVAVSDIGVSSVDATRLLMRDMGFNLLITPADADPARWQALDFSGPDMPEEYVKKLAGQRDILAQHFVGKLQHTTDAGGVTAVLTGVLAEVVRTGTEKTPMPTAYDVPGGRVFLGAAVARGLGKQAGDTVTLLGRDFTVDRVLGEYGAMPEDIRIFAHLHDAQELLGRPGRVNAIDALACQCPAGAADIIAMVRGSITRVLPDVEVRPYQSMLLGRFEQRAMMMRLQAAMVAAALAAAAAAVWGLSYQNVSARRHEIGVFRALGVPDASVAALFLVKTGAVALAGAALGVAAGRAYFLHSQVAGNPLCTPAQTLALVLLAAPLAAMLFSLPPVAARMGRDTAALLGEGAP